MQNLLSIIFSTKVFDIKIINEGDFYELLIRFSLNMLVCIAIAGGIYYPAARKKEYLFTYVLFSVIIFFLCHLLGGVKLELGFALGLFAIMGIIRYRTDSIPIKEMTYLFVIIGISVINALSNRKVSHIELLFTNFSMILIAFLLEKLWWAKQESNMIVTYEKIELIKPELELELIEDLKTRTGLDIHRVQIAKIDFLRDTAQLRIFYHDNSNRTTE